MSSTTNETQNTHDFQFDREASHRVCAMCGMSEASAYALDNTVCAFGPMVNTDEEDWSRVTFNDEDHALALDGHDTAKKREQRKGLLELAEKVKDCDPTLARVDLLERPTWHQTWMSIAEIISMRSYDPRMKVGCIVVSGDNTQILSLGYNGNYKGGPHEHESPTPGQSGFIHAEINALLKLDYNNPKKKIMYITHTPCRQCAKCIVNAGIDVVVWRRSYRDQSGLELLRESGVGVLHYDDAILIKT